MSTYNYASFPLDADQEDFERFPSVLPVGSKAPDHPLVDAATGAQVRLSDFYRGGAAVIEFGSLT